MPLSLQKLQELLVSKYYIPNSYYIMDDLLFYIEIFSIATSELFLLYIPSKYEFHMKDTDPDTYNLKYINLGISDNVADEYAGLPEQKIEDGIQLNPDKEGIEKYLESNYKHAIALKDIPEHELEELKSLFRQLRRLKYSVQNIKYKLAISYKNYLCAIRRDDSMNCFIINKYPKTHLKKLLVTTDLEVFYENSEKMIDDISRVKTSVERIFDRNRIVNSSIGTKITEKTLKQIPSNIQKKKIEYDVIILKLRKMLNGITQAEQNSLTELKNLEQQTGNSFQTDANRLHRKSLINIELENIALKKADIISTLLTVIEKRENAVLTVDKLMFDNNVMYDAIVKNYTKLKEFA